MTLHEKAAAAVRAYANPDPVTIRFVECPGEY